GVQLCDAPQGVPVPHGDKPPRLRVRPAWREPPGFQNLPHHLVGQRLIRELAYDVFGPDQFEGLVLHFPLPYHFSQWTTSSNGRRPRGETPVRGCSSAG